MFPQWRAGSGAGTHFWCHSCSWKFLPFIISHGILSVQIFHLGFGAEDGGKVKYFGFPGVSSSQAEDGFPFSGISSTIVFPWIFLTCHKSPPGSWLGNSPLCMNWADWEAAGPAPGINPILGCKKHSGPGDYY